MLFFLLTSLILYFCFEPKVIYKRKEKEQDILQNGKKDLDLYSPEEKKEEVTNLNKNKQNIKLLLCFKTSPTIHFPLPFLCLPNINSLVHY